MRPQRRTLHYITVRYGLGGKKSINIENNGNVLLEKNIEEMRREGVTNEIIREIMEIEHRIVDDLRIEQLIWFGHVQRMDDQRVPKRIFKC